MTLKEAHKKYGYSAAHLRVLIYRKELKGEKIGNTWTVKASDMEALMKTKASPPPKAG